MTDAEPIVFVVDDNRSVREAITSLLASVGLRAETFRTAEDFLQAPRPAVPACVILDVRLPGLSGLDLHKALVARGDPIPVIFITAHGDVPISVEAMKGGAVEFLLKPFRDQQILDVVQRAIVRHRGEQQRTAELTDLRQRYDSLTPREQQVMTHVVAGLLNKQIAAKLRTSEITIKVHRARVMGKMKVRSLAELVRAADRLSRPPGHV